MADQSNKNEVTSKFNGGFYEDRRSRFIDKQLAFTVDDIEREYKKVLALGAEIIEPPTKRPWGATNMSFYDPDHNIIYLRSFSKDI